MKVFRVALLISTLALSASLLAQMGPEQGGHGGMGHHMMSVDDRVNDLDQHVNFTGDQKTQVRSILQNQQDQMGQIMHDSSLSRQDRMEKMRDLHQSSNSKIRDLLNDDQKKKFDDYMQQQRQEMMQHHQGQGMGTGGMGAGAPQ